ncbi:TatD family hydrolase [Oceanisphaera avium]|uniref:Hydrolase TatD n=1 Tax=Oceanisphaera avium TaxID=1903694 RepID=A0A1Y0CXF1_9GAMM|nr:TatD family hydrolase [Oceanisphaera avium]ART80011.1 hydrolase TatD [Oceanisphaera avium]
MLLTDSHCHFDFAVFGPESGIERAEHWRQATAVGVHRLVIPGINESQWASLPALCAQYSGFYYGLGLHPWWLEQATDDWAEQLALALQQAARDERCVALGEIGLDKHIKVALVEQERALITQLKMAQQYELPVIIHSHGTHDRVLKWLRQYPVSGGVVHAFSGSLQQAQAFWQLGIHLGVGGTITYARASKTRRAIAAMPIEALVLETDAPDMPLCGFQGQANHPRQLPLVLSALSELCQLDELRLAAQLEQNVNRLFGWS